jgi:hypothetical protein
LDQPTPDAPAGATLEIAITVWDTHQGTLATAPGDYIRLRPATGSGKPTEASATSDWTGHMVARLVVPKGGPGAVEAGYRARSCTDAGACSMIDLPFRYGGVGPPPEAAAADLVLAAVHPFDGPLVAGVPFDVAVDLVPRGAWRPDAIAMPDQLVAIVNQPGGRDSAAADLTRGSTRDAPYAGSLTIPDAGDFTMDIAIPANGGEDRVLENSRTRLHVTDGEPSAAAAAPVAPATDGLPLPLVGGSVALILAAALVIRRVFADL